MSYTGLHPRQPPRCEADPPHSFHDPGRLPPVAPEDSVDWEDGEPTRLPFQDRAGKVGRRHHCILHLQDRLLMRATPGLGDPLEAGHHVRQAAPDRKSVV